MKRMLLVLAVFLGLNPMGLPGSGSRQVTMKFSTTQSTGLDLNPGDTFTVTFLLNTATPDRGRGPFGGKQYPDSVSGVTIDGGSSKIVSSGSHGIIVMSERSQWGMVRVPNFGTPGKGVSVEMLTATLTYERGILSDDSLEFPPKAGIIPASKTKHSISKSDFIAFGKLSNGKTWELAGEIVSLNTQP